MNIEFYGTSGMDYPENDVKAQAAYWFAVNQNENCSEAQLRAFYLWLSKHSTHQAAYDDCVMFYETAKSLSEDEDILTLRRSALGVGKTKSLLFKRLRRFSVAAALMFLAILLSVPQVHDVGENILAQLRGSNQPHADLNDLVLVTAIGEQLTRTLVDGSLIELNTDSEIRVKLCPSQRSIYLLKGQAVFSVAHDKTRPFVVFAGDRKVTALGTMFEVRLGSENAQVTLLEGKVKVDEVNLLDDQIPSLSQTKTVELLPGERYLSATDEMITVKPESIEADLSWRKGRHIFVDEKISHIVNELNRYTERKIIINDPQIGELRASANFKLGSTQSLSAALEATFDLKVTDDTSTNNFIIDWD